MKNLNFTKLGFNAKKNSDKILYTIIVILLTVFMFNMSNIYQFFQRVRHEGLFPNRNNVVEEKPQPPVVEEEPTDDPVGSSTQTCQIDIEDESGSLRTVVTLHYEGDELKSIVEEISYSATNDEFRNHIASQKAIYERRERDNRNLQGFSITITSPNMNNLTIRSVYNLTRISFLDVEINDNPIMLFGSLNANIDEIVQVYKDTGFECGVR